MNLTISSHPKDTLPHLRPDFFFDGVLDHNGALKKDPDIFPRIGQ